MQLPGYAHLPSSLVILAAQLGKKVAVVDYVEPSPRGRQPPVMGAVCPGEGVGQGYITWYRGQLSPEPVCPVSPEHVLFLSQAAITLKFLVFLI